MTCWLEDPEVKDILEEFDNDSTSCIFRMMDLQSHLCLNTTPGVSTKIKEAIKQIEKVQDTVEGIKELFIRHDDTEYYDGKYFSDMGWVMISNFLMDYIAAPSNILSQYIEKRTLDKTKIFTAVNRLVKQGLVERRRVMVPKMDDTSYTEGFETCIVMTPRGRELHEDISFIYSHEYMDGKESVEKYVNNILPFRRNEDDSTDPDDSS